MTEYRVQYEMPVNDPVNNVRMERKRGVIHFFVPLNHPDAHNLGLVELMAAVERRELLTLSTDLNNTVGDLQRDPKYARWKAKATKKDPRHLLVPRVAPVAVLPDCGGDATGQSPEGLPSDSSRSDIRR